ncbi:(d)CMP kinase [Treponema pedis]|uniref:(d)CMP kinase n=1 Tax=Treponema pedis TaxID=409322 RepID=UPI0003FA0824|nr:AAA family ATPase [Treponema pedis]QSI04854.1 cytidylate kinase [Treponema pedis]
MKKQLRIAISGSSGCGNTTVSNLLAQKLNLPCINYTFKNVAAELNIPFTELLEKAKTDFSFDKTVDTKQVELASKSSCVLGSRLAIWLLKDADLKIYLTASFDVRVNRIHNREGGDINEVKRITELRDKDDTRRYKSLYNIDNTDYGFADLIIDTEKNTPEKIVKIIIEELKKKNLYEANLK